MTDLHCQDLRPSADSYVLVTWTDAPIDEPVEWYEEIDTSRWSIRCVRNYRDGSLEAYRYSRPNWRDVMPEAAVPTVEELVQQPGILAKEISQVEFESVWALATATARRGSNLRPRSVRSSIISRQRRR